MSLFDHLTVLCDPGSATPLPAGTRHLEITRLPEWRKTPDGKRVLRLGMRPFDVQILGHLGWQVVRHLTCESQLWWPVNGEPVVDHRNGRKVIVLGTIAVPSDEVVDETMAKAHERGEAASGILPGWPIPWPWQYRPESLVPGRFVESIVAGEGVVRRWEPEHWHEAHFIVGFGSYIWWRSPRCPLKGGDR